MPTEKGRHITTDKDQREQRENLLEGSTTFFVEHLTRLAKDEDESLLIGDLNESQRTKKRKLFLETSKAYLLELHIKIYATSQAKFIRSLICADEFRESGHDFSDILQTFRRRDTTKV